MVRGTPGRAGLKKFNFRNTARRRPGAVLGGVGRQGSWRTGAEGGADCYSLEVFDAGQEATEERPGSALQGTPTFRLVEVLVGLDITSSGRPPHFEILFSCDRSRFGRAWKITAKRRTKK